MISIYLELDDLGQFQTVSPNILAATSDVSFYCRYLKQQIPKKAIPIIRLYRDKIPNWKKVVERFTFNNDKDQFYTDYNFAVRKREFGTKIQNPEQFDILIYRFNFAEEKNYRNLQHEVALYIIEGIFFFNVARNRLDFKKGLEHLPNLVQKLDYFPSAYSVCRPKIKATPYTGLFILSPVRRDHRKV
ncbi:hypothetical protein MP638_005095 [Amoeboaphelidium occidentale]|nr:hypothetical protein MP638_005095 [Amoeboaphelidium occidentale]